MTRLSHILRAFRRDEDGAALAEFALLLPSFLLFLGISIEGARTFWSYQSTITGVRDAARFISRAAPQDICATSGSLSGWDARLTEIVRETRSGETLFPTAITIEGVSATLVCSSSSYRGGQAPVASVTATLRIDYPFSGLFGLVNVSLEPITTVVTDQARIIGA